MSIFQTPLKKRIIQWLIGLPSLSAVGLYPQQSSENLATILKAIGEYFDAHHQLPQVIDTWCSEEPTEMEE